MITKEFIQQLIEKDKEPVYAIHGVLNKCSRSERKRVWDILEDLGFHGSERERSVVLYNIACENKQLANKLQDQLIAEINNDFAAYKVIVKRVITMIRRTKRKDNVPFCLSVLQWANENMKGSLLAGNAFRCIITVDWEKIISEIAEHLKDEDDLGVIDTVAYFLYKNGSGEYEKLKVRLPEETLQRINQLMPEIQDRLNNHYNLIEESEEYA